ncbi:radical SAM protein, partial [Bradyrhizobium sp. UFLA05-153]
DAGATCDALLAIPNIAGHDASGRLLQAPVRPVEQNLDGIPTPDFSNRDKYYLYGNDIYQIDNEYDDEPVYYLMTSRGCPYSCSFCCISFMKDLYKDTPGQDLRRRSVEHVIEELETAKARQPSLRYVYFFDDVFVFDRKWIEAFAKEYKARIGLPFWCYGYVNTTKPPLIAALKEAGIEGISMGIQSGSERIRRSIFMRPESDEAVRAAAALVHRHGIRVTWDIICSPFETEEDKRNGFHLYFSLPKPFSFHFHPLSYYRNLGVTRRAMQMGLIGEEDIVSRHVRLTQSITDFESFAGNALISNDRYYRLLKLFGRRYVPNALIRALLGANRGTVLFGLRLHDQCAPPRLKFFQPPARSNFDLVQGLAARDV